MLKSVLQRLVSEKTSGAATVCFCTLAIHEPYRRRARVLCADAPQWPWVVLTDEPDDFADLPVKAIRHAPTGPMAADYLSSLPPTGEGRGAAAYHDKRFALLAALQDYNTAVYVDADSRISGRPAIGKYPRGLAVLPVVRKSVAEHLETCGSWRMPVFRELAQHLSAGAGLLNVARWCHETLIAVTKDDREKDFFAVWEQAADFLRQRGVYSGEGGVIGLAAAVAGWSVDYDSLTKLANSIQHEGGGPKEL